MPKQLPYPKFNFQESLKLAEVVKKHQPIALANAAILLSLQKGGHFMNLVSSAAKFGLLYNQKGFLSLSTLGQACLNTKSKGQACLEALQYPKGFGFLFKHWQDSHSLPVELLINHLQLTTAQARQASTILMESFEWVVKHSQVTVPLIKKKDTSPQVKKQACVKVTLSGLGFDYHAILQNKAQVMLLEALLSELKNNLS